jgi:hypothetical protein
MKNNLDKNQTPDLAKRTVWSKEDYQKLEFASITDAITFILKNTNYPLNLHRNIIDALQGVANGRSKFPASHLTLARRMGHEGGDEAAKMCAYRELKVLKKFQFESQILLFDIEQGGGKEKKSNVYENHLIGAAVWLANHARELKKSNSELKLQPLGKIMEGCVEEAVKRLAPFAGSKFSEQFSPKANAKKAAKRLKTKNERRKTLREQMDENLRRCLNEYDPATEEEELRAFVSHVAQYMFDTVESMIASAQESKSSDLSHMMTLSSLTSYLDPDNKTGDDEGLHGSSPSQPESNFVEAKGKIPEKQADTKKSDDFLKTVLGYARQGWKIIPLHTPDEKGVCSCSKGEKCTSPGKHPRTANGVRESSTDEQTIRNWWNRFPGSNIGIATGEDSGIVCLDIDPRNGGNEAFDEIIKTYGTFPVTFEVSTGGGGRHLFFKYPEGKTVKNSTQKIGKGIDIKSSGGFVVAAPSLHSSGRRYFIKNHSRPATMPEWLLNLSMEEKNYKSNVPAQHAPESVPKMQSTAISVGTTGSLGKLINRGERNVRLYKTACAIVGRGETPEKVYSEIYRVNITKCNPPLDDAEVQTIIASALKHRIDQPAAAGSAG